MRTKQLREFFVMFKQLHDLLYTIQL